MGNTDNEVKMPARPYGIFVMNHGHEMESIRLLDPEYKNDNVVIKSDIPSVSYNEILRSLIQYPAIVSKILILCKMIGDRTGSDAMAKAMENFSEQILIVTKDGKGSSIRIPLELNKENKNADFSNETVFRLDSLTYLQFHLPPQIIFEMYIYAR